MNTTTDDYRLRIYEKYGENFQDAGARFDETSAGTWSKAYRHYFRGWLPQDKNAAIVDLACGGGRVLHFFRTRGYTKLTGVDISPDQVAISRQVVPDVLQQDVLDFLAQCENRFDLISGLDIVEHFHKPEVFRFLDGCFAALKPRGRLILQTPNADSPWGTMHRYNDFSHEVGFNPNALTRLMRLSGFIDMRAREVGPVPLGYSAGSTLRYVTWQAIRAGLKIWNLAEMGNVGSGVFTRVFLISGNKP